MTNASKAPGDSTTLLSLVAWNVIVTPGELVLILCRLVTSTQGSASAETTRTNDAVITVNQEPTNWISTMRKDAQV